MTAKQSTRAQRIARIMLLIVGVSLMQQDVIWFSLLGGGLLGVFVYEVSE